MTWSKLLNEKSALATALDLIGDKWTLMIISGSFASVHRFNELEQSLGINRNLLSSRLNRLIDAGVVEKTIYQEKPRRFEYKLTDIGEELKPVIVGLSSWSEKNLTKEATPISMVHTVCECKVTARIHCSSCDAVIPNNEIDSRLNPNAGEESHLVFKESKTPYID